MQEARAIIARQKRLEVEVAELALEWQRLKMRSK